MQDMEIWRPLFNADIPQNCFTHLPLLGGIEANSKKSHVFDRFEPFFPGTAEGALLISVQAFQYLLLKFCFFQIKHLLFTKVLSLFFWWSR